MAIGNGTAEEFIINEFQSLDLKDKRLVNRAKKILISLQKNPTTCFRHLYPNQKDTRQAYDFFSNRKVTGKAMMAFH